MIIKLNLLVTRDKYCSNNAIHDIIVNKNRATHTCNILHRCCIVLVERYLMNLTACTFEHN